MALLPHEQQIFECEQTIEKVKKHGNDNTLWSKEEIIELEKKLSALKNKIYSELKPWDRVAISRHPDRPHTIHFIKNICEEFVEIFGDRNFRDDKAIITGMAKIDGKKFIVAGLEKGHDINTRLLRNFGMAHPEGYRKALRAMHLAAKFNLPVLTFLDTPGAYPGLSAEERGQGWAIAKNLFEMARLPVPIIVVIIGEGCSGGALGLGVGDKIGMLEHAYYSVISPEGCSSILWKDATKNAVAAQALKIQAEDLLELDVIDSIIKEPLGGAHRDPSVVYQNTKSFISESLSFLKEIPKEDLVEMRYQKFRKMGKFSIL